MPKKNEDFVMLTERMEKIEYVALRAKSHFELFHLREKIIQVKLMHNGTSDKRLYGNPATQKNLNK